MSLLGIRLINRTCKVDRELTHEQGLNCNCFEDSFSFLKKMLSLAWPAILAKNCDHRKHSDFETFVKQITISAFISDPMYTKAFRLHSGWGNISRMTFLDKFTRGGVRSSLWEPDGRRHRVFSSQNLTWNVTLSRISAIACQTFL